MQNNFTHIIYTPFTGLGHNNGYGGDEWFKKRIEVFKKFTHRSLLAQTNRNFVHWLSFRPEEKSNPLVKELEEYLNKFPEYQAVFTFEGVMYVDDRFPLDHTRNSSLLQRVARVMEGWKEIVKTPWILSTRLDSDDMLSHTAVEEIQKQKLFEGSFIYQNGYLYNSLTNETAEWNPKTCPPFYTIVFKKKTFLDAKEHLDFMKEWGTHEDTVKFPHKYLNDKQYCVVIHGNHLATESYWKHHFKGKELPLPDNFDFPEKTEMTSHDEESSEELIAPDNNEQEIIKAVREMAHYSTLTVFKNSPTAVIEFKMMLKKPSHLKKEGGGSSEND